MTLEKLNAAEALVLSLNRGDRVRFRGKGKVLWEEGTVRGAWNCLGELAVDIATDDVTPITILPGLGDELEALR